MPEYALDEAKVRLAEIVSAAERGERVVITKDGEPAVQLVRCERKKNRGFDWDKLNANRRRLGIEDASAGGSRRQWMAAFRRFRPSAASVLGLDDDESSPSRA